MRDDVLARIDLTPNLTQANRDKLYNDMERARRMGMVVRIPFSSGKTGLTASDIQSLKEVLETPSLMKLRDDPTAVFVVLGYADTKGDQTKNLPISQKRADSVTEAMRVKCNVANVMHAVAMGGTTLHDSASLEKNRVVEVWAVLP
jgi:outer membrane protein OmpA-like peptidoglycan-associated protein